MNECFFAWDVRSSFALQTCRHLFFMKQFINTENLDRIGLRLLSFQDLVDSSYAPAAFLVIHTLVKCGACGNFLLDLWPEISWFLRSIPC